MENATKALIIAGAVLIAILIIGVAMMIFGAASDPVNQATNSSEAQAVRMFNESFTPYLGNNITAQQAKSLISAVNSSNARNDEHDVELAGAYTSVSAITTKKHYKATEEYDKDGSGYISKITISDPD